MMLKPTKRLHTFSPGPDAHKVTLDLVDLGYDRVLRFRDAANRFYDVEANHGPQGFAIRIRCGSAATFVTSTADGDFVNGDVVHMEMCQYDATPRAQAFRRWYLNKETEADITLLGSEYQRHKRAREEQTE